MKLLKNLNIEIHGEIINKAADSGDKVRGIGWTDAQKSAESALLPEGAHHQDVIKSLDNKLAEAIGKPNPSFPYNKPVSESEKREMIQNKW